MGNLLQLLTSILRAILAVFSGGKEVSGTTPAKKEEAPLKTPPVKGFKPSKRTIHNLEGVHPDLVKVCLEGMSISFVDFTVTEGLRGIERQKALVADGKSQTMNSRHLTGHAFDIVCYDEEGNVTWEMDYYRRAADAILKAANKLNVEAEWGGNWKSFVDGPHFQLSRKHYP